ncbi:MAG: hypothetical protein LBG58_02195 [Planctomycetaceae bacterium]|jgi:hypothetical protein|nr:hypothetical protein [Planctomycetaceae bacterium]
MISFKKKKNDDEVADSTIPESAPSTRSEIPVTLPKPKPQPDIYTLLLGLSVAALVIATVILYLNLNAYGPNPLAGIKT